MTRKFGDGFVTIDHKKLLGHHRSKLSNKSERTSIVTFISLTENSGN